MQFAFGRRTFLGQLMSAYFLGVSKLLGRQVLNACTNETPSALWAVIPEELRYVRVELADSENAWPLWRQAIDRLEESDRLITLLIEEGMPGPDTPFLTREMMDASEQLLFNGRDALRYFEQGVMRRRLQIPLPPRNDFVFFREGREIMGIQSLAQLIVCRARKFALAADLDAAVREWLLLHKATRLLADGEGHFLAFSTAYSIGSMTCSGMRFLARDSQITLEQLKMLQDAIDDSSLLNGYRTTHGVEVCVYWLTTIESLPSSIELLLTNLHRYFRFSYVPIESREQRQHRFQNIARILHGHPRPFDKIETIALISEIHQVWLNDLRKVNPPSGPRYLPPQVIHAMTTWPKEIPLVTKFNPMPTAGLTEDEFRLAQQKLHAIDNPIGRVLISRLFLSEFRHELCSYTLQSRATQLVLALRIYKKRFGTFPAHLEELVERDVVESLPLHPNMGNSFAYSAQKGAIWSVESNGANDTNCPMPSDGNGSWQGPWSCQEVTPKMQPLAVQRAAHRKIRTYVADRA